MSGAASRLIGFAGVILITPEARAPESRVMIFLCVGEGAVAACIYGGHRTVGSVEGLG